LKLNTSEKGKALIKFFSAK